MFDFKSEGIFKFLSIIFRYVFIVIIYLFMFGIIRMIYLDVKNIRKTGEISAKYLKLINRKDEIPYRVEDEYPILRDITIGRSKENYIYLNDPYISKNHCRIGFRDDTDYIEDLKSSNGTYLNGKLIEGIHALNHGDRIKVGSVEFLFVKTT